jgi:hypothetical protein
MPDEARYIYCIVRSATGIEPKEDLGEIGIEKKAVYTIPYKDIAAVVHSCQPKPYDTKDRKQAEEWILEHSYVIDHATKMFGSVLPFSFDVILLDGDAQIEEWLCKNYEHLHSELESVKAKAEYSIRIYYDYDTLKSRILTSDQELNDLQKKIEKESKGKAYLLSKKLDQKLKVQVDTEAKRLAEESLSRIESHVDKIVANDKIFWTPENCRDKKLLISYSCLVNEDRVERLGEMLDEINALEGFIVKFTGPWAPFSFVKLQSLS